MSSSGAGGRAELPTTISWYRDAANWIVGLSTGVLAGAIAYKDDILSASANTRLIFIGSVVCFIAALVSGIQFYLWITSYANQREYRDARAAERPNLPAAEQPKVDKQIQDAEAGMTRAQRRYGYFHTILLWTFHLGVLGYMVGTIALFTTPKQAQTQHTWELVSMPCCPTARCRLPQPHVLRIDKTTGETWYLTADSTHVGVWQRVPESDSTMVPHR